VRVDSWLARASGAHPDRPAVNALTYSGLSEAACRAAAALDVAAGETVAIALPAGTDFVVALHAIWMRGAVAVPHDLRLNEAERPVADHVLTELPEASAQLEPPPFHDLGLRAVVLQTSGTTGPGKLVEITFSNLLWSALGSAAALGVHPQERWLSALPLSHVGGLSIPVRAAIMGTTAIVHDGWDTELVLRSLHDDAITIVSVVPTTLARLLDAGLQRPAHLRCALVGGGPVDPELMSRAKAAGVPVAQTYGLTETCSQVTTQRPGDEHADAGPPLFCTRVGIAPDGEILVSGPTVAGGSTEPLATGDLGSLDGAGRLTVTGRKADTIVSGGENIAPTEVEAVLLAHPAVAEAAVFGRKDPSWGEAVAAHVVLRAGLTVPEAELLAFCSARLARFKVPKSVEAVGELPRTRSGKLLRSALRPPS
jgi:O-succinylbenzoic acid--CoA ligase